MLVLSLLLACQDSGFTVYDTPPTADITAPADGSAVWEGVPVDLLGLVHDNQTDGSDLTVQWSVDLGSQPVDAGVDADGIASATWTPDEPGTVHITLHVSAEGVGVDDTLVVAVMADDAPAVTWVSPTDAQDFAAEAPPPLVATITDEHDAPASVALAWFANDTPLDCPASAEADGTATCSLASLPAGSLALCLWATDSAGNTGVACRAATATGCTPVTWYADLDGDGYGDASSASEACDAPSGTVADGTDCDDTDAGVNPGAAEADCTDPNDYNCDGSVGYADADGDGFPACEDCNDAAAAVNPDGTEVCNGVDDDCDGTSDPSTSTDAATWYTDLDGDGFGDAGSASLACDAPAAAVADATDCDDTDAAYNPGAAEADCTDPNDYNCDGSVGYADADADGFPACEDCNDADADVNPDGIEVCNGVDDDCDGSVDPDSSADAATWYADLDGDGFGDAGATSLACDAPSGTVADDTDCDDTDADVNPDGIEVCNGVDDDCDGSVDPDSSADAATWYADLDGDGFGDAGATSLACDAPSGTVADDTDCDDADADVNPDGIEVCNGVDDDCDGSIDPDSSADAATWYADLDGDGFGDAGATSLACDAPASYVADDTDCDDTDADVNPDGIEVCNGVDDDCDGSVDWGLGVPSSYSTVNAAVAAASTGSTICVAPGTYSGVVTLNKRVIIEGYDGPDVTILDGAAGGSVIKASGYTGTAEVHGVTLQNGSGTQGVGVYASSVSLWLDDVVASDNVCGASATYCHGVIFGTGATLTLTNVTVRDNDAYGGTIYGGAMSFWGSSVVTAENVEIVDNYAAGSSQVCPGIWMYPATFTGTNLVIAGNDAAASDAAAWMIAEVFTGSKSTLKLTNASITGNTMNAGSESVTGTVLMYTSTDVATFINVAITDNVYTASASAWQIGGVLTWTSSSFTSSYSNYYNNTYTTFYGISGVTGYNGNVTVAAGYTDVTAADAADWDLSLQATSAMVNAGSTAILDTDGSVSDIGAWGGPGAADW